jgi:hypothetical protein
MRAATWRGSIDRQRNCGSHADVASCWPVLRETIRRNRVRWDHLPQVTRGVAKRDFPFPAENTRPSLS